ncbi:MAG: Wzz/FepE/Etk N-terminal domain-containing protein, partial [Bacteroidota bacterium]
MKPQRENGQGNDSQEFRSTEESVISAVRTIFEWRRFIAGVTASVAVLAVAISLLLPNWYRAEARVLAPEGGAGNAMAAQVLRNLPSAASMFLGGGTGNYARYLTILSSRTALESVVDSFDLVTVYKTSDDDHPRENAVAMLRSNLEYPVDERYEFLSVAVYDMSPD